MKPAKNSQKKAEKKYFSTFFFILIAELDSSSKNTSKTPIHTVILPDMIFFKLDI